MQINSLPKKDIILIVADFDDTIFSRKEQLENDENLVKFRWAEWNNYIVNVLWIDNLIKKYYAWKNYPKTITSQLKKYDLILTVWVKELQEAKLKATWLDKINYIVVEHWVEKPDKLVQYVIEDLKFIPKKIVIYEDRPDYFIEKKSFIEEYLWTNLEIMFVEMVSNNKEPKIKKIE